MAMEEDKIREQVVQVLRKIEERRDYDISVTEGAIDAVVMMIRHIEKDPSPYWADYILREDMQSMVEIEAYQRAIITMLPSILRTIDSNFSTSPPPTTPREETTEISSWEIWHQFDVVSRFYCPIDKA